MRLLIDIGNTRIKWMCLSHEELITSGHYSRAFTHHQNFSIAVEECFGVDSDFEKQLSSSKLANVVVKDVVVSNVAGKSAADALTELSVQQWQVKPFYVEVTRELAGVYNDYEELSELGVDRWVAVIGARQYFSEGNVIVINCGTAITVDLLGEDNHFKGGAILPGFELAAKALSQADGIAKIEPSTILEAIGTSTQECVKLGIIAACVGGVEFIIHKLQSQSGFSQANLLLSGGAAPLFLDASQLECEYDANVIMRGLNRIIECEF